MRAMRDSGVEWIGEMPEEWTLRHFKYLAEVRANLVSPYDYPELVEIDPDNIESDTGKLLNVRTVEEVGAISSKQHFNKGQILYSKIRPGLNKVVMAPSDGLCSADMYPITAHCEERWLLYMMRSDCFVHQATEVSNMRVKMPKVNVDELGAIQIPTPPLDEQRRIADYLDARCADIDAVSQKVRSEIDLLGEYRKSVIYEAVAKGLDKGVPMRDSGIEWIGEIPKGWDTLKGKYVFEQRNEKGNRRSLRLLSPTQNYGVIPQDMYEELTGMRPVKLKQDTDLNTLKTIHKGDYCISLRSFQGGFEYSEYEGVVSPAYQVFYPIINVFDGYYRHLFKTSAFIDKMNSYTMSMRDGKNIAFDDFGNTLIPIPPIDEQRRIADYLDARCADIDAIIAKKRRQLDVLADYRKSLIYECATGKREVA